MVAKSATKTPAAKKTDAPAEIDVIQMQYGYLDFCCMGITPFIYHSVGLKAKTEGSTGILPVKPKTKTEQENTPKHMPFEEFKESCYYHLQDSTPTRLMIPARMPKKAMRNVTKDIPKLAGAEVGRLVWVMPEEISLYGIPQIYTTVLWNSGYPKVMDVRTRAIVPQWAFKLRVRYIRPNISGPSVVNLLANAGLLCGLGDGRVEKGNTDFGQFTLVDEDNVAFQEIIRTGGKEAQDAALKDPLYYNSETQQLLEYWNSEWKKADWEARLKKLSTEKKRSSNGEEDPSFVPDQGNGEERAEA